MISMEDKKFRRKMLVAVFLLVGLFLIPGCESDFGMQSSSVKKVMLMASQAAINMDYNPGPDGFVVQVYLFEPSRGGLPVPARGDLDFILYDKRVSVSEIHMYKPYLIWTYTETELSNYVSKGMAGMCYSMSLQWGKNIPANNTVTVVSRYRPNDGSPAIFSDPIVMSLSN